LVNKGQGNEKEQRKVHKLQL